VAQATVAIKQLPHHKVKVKKPGQRSCNEKDDKGKICGGHLKRWFYMADVLEQACGDVAQTYGPDAEIYRCEHCKTLYLPNPEDPHGLNVAGQGTISTFGLTLPPKDAAKTAEKVSSEKPAADKGVAAASKPPASATAAKAPVETSPAQAGEKPTMPPAAKEDAPPNS
jgi:hypothetical protein